MSDQPKPPIVRDLRRDLQRAVPGETFVVADESERARALAIIAELGLNVHVAVRES